MNWQGRRWWIKKDATGNWRWGEELPLLEFKPKGLCFIPWEAPTGCQSMELTPVPAVGRNLGFVPKQKGSSSCHHTNPDNSLPLLCFSSFSSSLFPFLTQSPFLSRGIFPAMSLLSWFIHSLESESGPLCLLQNQHSEILI